MNSSQKETEIKSTENANNSKLKNRWDSSKNGADSFNYMFFVAGRNQNRNVGFILRFISRIRKLFFFVV